MNISSDVIEEIIELRQTENIEDIYKNYYLTCENSTRKYYLTEKKIKDLTLKFLINNALDIEEYDFLDGEEQQDYKKTKKLIKIFEEHIDNFAKEYVYVLSLKNGGVYIGYTIEWKVDIPENFRNNKYDIDSLIYIFPNGDLATLYSIIIYFMNEFGSDKVVGNNFNKKIYDCKNEERIVYVKELFENDKLIKKSSPLMIKLHKKKKVKKGKKLNTSEPPEILNGSDAFN